MMPVVYVLGRKLRPEDSEFRPELHSKTLPQERKKKWGRGSFTAFRVTYYFICGH